MSRTYNRTGEGTYGQAISGTQKAAAGGEEQVLGFLSENDDFRTNLGFVNTTGETIMVDVEFFDSEGHLLGSRNAELKPYSNTIWSRAFAVEPINADSIEAGWVRSRSASGGVLVYASLIDNRTGDPTTILPY